jgi:hypothetical protein
VAEIPDLPERIARLESGESLADADRDADRLDADRLVAAGQDFNAKQLPNRVVPDDELIDAARHWRGESRTVPDWRTPRASCCSPVRPT